MKFTSNKFVYFVLVSCFVVITHAQSPANDNKSETSNGDNKITGKFNSSLSINHFKENLFRLRIKHKKAVDKLRTNGNSYEYKYKTIEILFKTMIETFKSNENIINNVLKIINNNETFYFTSIEMKQNVSSVLENISLFSHIALQLPDMTHRIFRAKNTYTWKNKFHEILLFANQTKFLLDDKTIDLIDLAFQELNITPRLPTYHNPYSSENKVNEKDDKKLNKKKDKKKKSGPQMARQEL